MLKNYFISAIRSLLGDRLYSSINTIGLAIGLATGFLIFSWVKQELSYDRHYEGHDRIFRVATGWEESGDESVASTYPMMKDKVLAQFPEIEGCTRVYNNGFLGSKTRIAIGDKIFTDDHVYYADSSFFQLFPFKILKGDKTSLFSSPNAVILTERAAQKYFGDDDPLGKTILMDNSKELVVTGVVENIPPTTHFGFDLLISMQSHPWIKGAEERLWSGIVFYTYIKLKPGTDAQTLAAKINDYLDHFPNDPNGYAKALKMELQPVEDIHLQSHLRWELQPGGNITYVYLFITIAILVIVVACINYINLATACYIRRVKEVGVRKVFGAARRQLIFQFMTESITVTFVALVASSILVHLAKPWLEQTTGQAIPLADFYSRNALFLYAGTALVVGLGSGFFPAIVLSGFRPLQLFKPGLRFTPGGGSVRKVLVVFQFTVSIILTVCTTVTWRQLQFVQAANLGYDKEQVLVLPIRYDEILPRYREFKSALLENSYILSASATSQLPTNITEGENIDISKSETLGVYYVSVDEDFFRTLDITMTERGKVNEARPVKGVNQFVLNESALAKIGWDRQDAVGRPMSIRHGNMQPGVVVGVVSDFHFQSLHETIGPLVLELDPEQYEYLLVKIAPGKVEEAVDFIHAQWKVFAGTVPFDYNFLDQQYDQLYKSEKRIGSLFLVFASIASFIALLGLFGLASFAVEKRTKEIGIRRVLGASVMSIIKLLVQDFSWLLLAALVIALPASYYYSREWLQTFAYRIPLSSSVFIIAGLINISLAAITLLYHGLKASGNNPVESLRNE